MMRLYGYWRSSASWRIRIALHLKGIPFENVPVNLLQGEHRGAAHQARSPLAQVPVLEWEHDGATQRLSQSMAILELLDQQLPNPPLYPSEPFARVRAIELAEVINSGTHPNQNASVLRSIEQLGGDRTEWARAVIGRGLAAFDTLCMATRGAYSLGDAVTVADVMLVPQLYNARRYGVDLTPLQSLTEIEARCMEHAAFADAHADRQPDALGAK